MSISTKSNIISSYIVATWRHWFLSLGLVCVLLIVSPLVSRYFLPFVAFGFAGMLGAVIYSRRKHNNQGQTIPYIITVSLFFTGIAMSSFNLTIKITDVYEFAGKPVNDELPYIAQLTISPIVAIISGLFILRRLGAGRYFRTSTGRSDVSLVQRMVWQETRYQTRLLFSLSLSLSIVAWTYTYFSFSSMSLNMPDRFFFIWLPVIVYVLSLIYLGFRCFSLWAFYSQNDPVMMLNPHRSSIIRYLIIADDAIYLSRKHLNVIHGMESFFDTPVRLRVPFADEMDGESARNHFIDYTGIDNGIKTVKFLFDGFGHAMDNSMFHFLCVLKDKNEVDDSRISSGQWFSLDELRRLDYNHQLSAELSAELVHIYTVAMAWKSYDINGNRKYKIKNYRPTYHLCDIERWDVDYTDVRWLRIARLNADKPLFRIRRFFNRITSPSLE